MLININTYEKINVLIMFQEFIRDQIDFDFVNNIGEISVTLDTSVEGINLVDPNKPNDIIHPNTVAIIRPSDKLKRNNNIQGEYRFAYRRLNTADHYKYITKSDKLVLKYDHTIFPNYKVTEQLVKNNVVKGILKYPLNVFNFDINIQTDITTVTLRPPVTSLLYYGDFTFYLKPNKIPLEQVIPRVWDDFLEYDLTQFTYMDITDLAVD